MPTLDLRSAKIVDLKGEVREGLERTTELHLGLRFPPRRNNMDFELVTRVATQQRNHGHSEMLVVARITAEQDSDRR
jgi:hypothetical protein